MLDSISFAAYRQAMWRSLVLLDSRILHWSSDFSSSCARASLCGRDICQLYCPVFLAAAAE